MWCPVQWTTFTFQRFWARELCRTPKRILKTYKVDQKNQRIVKGWIRNTKKDCASDIRTSDAPGRHMGSRSRASTTELYALSPHFGWIFIECNSWSWWARGCDWWQQSVQAIPWAKNAKPVASWAVWVTSVWKILLWAHSKARRQGASSIIELSLVDLTVLFRSYATSFCSKWSKLSKPVRINRVFCRLRLVSLITVTVMNIESKFRSFFSLTCIFNFCAPPKTKTSVVLNPIHHLLNNILILLTHRVLDSKSNNIRREK